MKKLFKKFKKMFKTKKPINRRKPARRKKPMAILKIELGDNMKDIANKLRDLANQIDPVDCKCQDITPENLEEKTNAAEKRVVDLDSKRPKKGKKTLVAKEEVETFEEVEAFDPSDESNESEFDSFEEGMPIDQIEDDTPTLQGAVIPACKEFTKKNGEKGRAKIAAILKEFKAKSIHELKPENYSKFLNKLGVK